MSTAPDAPAAYDDLLDRYERISNLEHVSGLLNWDQNVTMPEAGTPARAGQAAAVSAVHHDLLTSDAVADLLAELDGADLTPAQEACVREIRREHERAGEVPADLVEELSTVQSEAHEAWQRAKADDDFGAFEPHLERLLELHRERAAHIDPDKPAFEVMYEDGEPHLPIDTIEDVFAELKATIVPLVEEIREDGRDLPSPFEGTYDEGTQEALSRDALDLLGFDWERGRLDTSPHPFTSGTQFDCRITTRFREDDPLDALTATIHEFGHATYQLGLPQDRYGSPLGESGSHGVHESQSRFWENHVGRTRAFWERFLPTLRERFPRLSDASVDEVYAAANRIVPENTIRVEADELTYHLHIVLRWEIERALVAGDIDVSAVPQVWNEKTAELLGVRPDGDAEGCLQDIHWTSGFASFQNYTVGSVFAAQLDAALREALDEPADELIRAGEFEPFHEFMTERVHRHGRRYPTDELMREATGEPLTAAYFVDYAEEKFGELYGL